MILGGPIETYLRELRRKLPYPAPRLVAETRAHLIEAAARAAARTSDAEEAERQAVVGYGAPEVIAAAVTAEGSALMSPGLLRWIPWAALLLTAPAVIFLTTNGIEHLAGSDGSEGAFGSVLDRWQTPVTGLLVFGPFVALALLIMATTRVDLHRRDGEINLAVEVKLSRGQKLAVIGMGLVIAAMVTYGLTENLKMPGGFFGGDWSCTYTPSDRMVCTQL